MKSICIFLMVIIAAFLQATFYAQKYQNVIVYGLETVKINEKLIAGITSKNIQQKAQSIINSLLNEGYLTCSLDSLVVKDSVHQNHQLYFFLGEKYMWAKLSLHESNKQLIQQSGFGEKNFTNKPLNPKQLVAVIENIISYLENNGYPFAQVSLKEINLDGLTISAKLNINKGPAIQVSKIILKGDDAIDKKIITTIININEGDLFNQSLIYSISSRIKEISYLEEIRPSEYEFIDTDCHLYLYVKNNNANSFNGIVGVLPSDNGKINITGEARIRLLNTLRKGELLDINWRKLLPLTQNLNLHVNYPFLFSTNFGIDSKFDLYKKDTSYIDLNLAFGVSYFINANIQFTGYLNSRRSDLISTTAYQFSTTLPTFADVSITSYGMLIDLNYLNYKYNPTKGFKAQFDISAGAKKIRKNTGLNEIVYTNIELNSSAYKGALNIEHFIPIKKRSTLKSGLNSGLIINENIFENELFRIGGTRTIRGFDEESIFASSFSIGTLEFRYLLEENSNIFVFTEAAQLQSKTRQNYTNAQLYGFGAGINFETKAGIFSVSYALGARVGNPLLIRSAKIHFGFVNYF